MDRRTFLRRAAIGSAGCLVVGGTAYAATPAVEMTHRVVALPALPDSFDGFRILQLSDTHIGTYSVCERLLRRSVESARTERFDAAVITGDFVDQLARNPAAAVEIGLAILAPLLRPGTPFFFVPGNHDNAARIVELESEFQSRGIHVLRNSSHTFERGGKRLHLIGLDDLYSGRYDFPHAARGVPEHETRILLQHNPDYIEYHATGRYDLQISGHLHGGQIRVPMLGAPIVPSRFGRRYIAGLKQARGRQIYISRGIGMTFLPVRVDCPSEVALLELHPTAS